MNQNAVGSELADACASWLATTYGPDRITKSVYDAAGQVLQEMRAVGTPLQETYATNTWTPNGKLASVYDADGANVSDTYGNVLASTYDNLGRKLSETDTSPTLAAKTVSYSYNNGTGDPVDRARLTWPDGYTVNYSYDALGHLTTVTDSGSTTLATYSYDNLARRAQVQYNGTAGARMLYSWSAENDLLTLSSTFSTSSSSYNVAYTHTFTPAHQWATSAISNAAWRYTPAALTLSYGAANGLNQVSAFNTTALHWDANGNYVGSAAGFEVYDAENRLMASGTTGTYAYDPLGRRSMTTFSGTQTNFVHDGDSEIAEYDASGNLLRRFVPGAAIDEYVAMVTGSGTKTFFHTDKMGSVVAMSDVNGNLAEGPYLYDAYGRCFNAGGSTCAAGEPFRYTGQRDDLPTNTYYYRARYYSPILGFFFQTDPVGYKDDLNDYSYVHDDPTDATDPSGLASNSTACGESGQVVHCYSGVEQKDNTKHNPWTAFMAPLAKAAQTATNVAEKTAEVASNARGAAALVSATVVTATATAILLATTSSTVGRDGDESRVTLYRAVEKPELQYIEKTGNYGFSPNGSGKYFALTPAGVLRFTGAEQNAGRGLTVTYITVPKEVAASGDHFNDIGAAGLSVHFSDARLPVVYSTMTPVVIVPNSR